MFKVQACWIRGSVTSIPGLTGASVFKGPLVRFLFGGSFLVLMLALGFTFTLIQGMREELTYRMRLVSSAISISIAVYLVVSGGIYLLSGTIPGIAVGILSLFVAYRLISTDIKTWRWFRGIRAI